MKIQKGEKEFTAKKTQTGWTVTRILGGVKVEYQVPNENARDEEELKRFIMDNDELF